MRHSYLNVNRNNSRELNQVIDLYEEYYREIYGDLFIGDRFKILKMFKETKNTIGLIHKGKTITGFFEFKVDNECGMVKPYVYLRYMYIRPEYRSSVTIGRIYEVMALVSYMNGNIKVVGDTYTSSANIHNNEIAGGEIISNTFCFTPIKTNFGRRLIAKGLKRYGKEISICEL